MKTIRKLALPVLFTLAVGIQMFVLQSLDYSTSWLVDVSAAETVVRPTPAFEMGGLRWPVDAYAASPALHELRRNFDTECGGRRSIEAALCVSDRMSRQFPHGGPDDEYVAGSFDPTTFARHHAGGAPGHCGTRSAILAGELLAVGVPARIVQLVHFDGRRDHNVVEIWDAEQGWVVVDPTYGGMVGTADGPTSMLELSKHATEIRWFPVGRPPDPFGNLEPSELEMLYRGLFPSAIVYPEP